MVKSQVIDFIKNNKKKFKNKNELILELANLSISVYHSNVKRWIGGKYRW